MAKTLSTAVLRKDSATNFMDRYATLAATSGASRQGCINARLWNVDLEGRQK
jgi:hypothetical protein